MVHVYSSSDKSHLSHQQFLISHAVRLTGICWHYEEEMNEQDGKTLCCSASQKGRCGGSFTIIIIIINIIIHTPIKVLRYGRRTLRTQECVPQRTDWNLLSQTIIILGRKNLHQHILWGKKIQNKTRDVQCWQETVVMLKISMHRMLIQIYFETFIMILNVKWTLQIYFL